MQTFYFTYGTDPAYPFRGGWTEVEAPNIHAAAELFRKVHPDRLSSKGILNCAFIYEGKKFKATEMYKDSNFGGTCHERITAHSRELLDAESEGS